jgi:hypothetical protein
MHGDEHQALLIRLRDFAQPFDAAANAVHLARLAGFGPVAVDR